MAQKLEAYKAMACITLPCISTAYIAMIDILPARIISAYKVLACIDVACIVMAYINMAYITLACIVLAYMVMAHIANVRVGGTLCNNGVGWV